MKAYEYNPFEVEKVVEYETGSHHRVLCTFSSNGDYMAYSDDKVYVVIIHFSDKDCLVEVDGDTWCPDVNGRSVMRIETGAAITCLTFGKGILEASRLPKRSNTQHYSFTKNERVTVLAVGLANGLIRLYNPEEESVLFVLQDHIGAVTSVSISWDGSLRLASTGQDTTCKLWDLWDEGNMYQTLSRHGAISNGVSVLDSIPPNRSALLCCAWSPDSSLLCMTGMAAYVTVYNPVNYVEVARLRGGHYHDVLSCQFSANGALLATASRDSSVVIWSTASFKQLRQFWHMGHRPSTIYLGGMNGHYVFSVAISPDCTHMATVCDDRRLRVWILDDPGQPILVHEEAVPLGVRNFRLTGVSFSMDGSFLATGTSHGRLLLIRCPTVLFSLSNLCRKSILGTITQSLTKGSPREGLDVVEAVSTLPLPHIIKDFLTYGIGMA